MKNQIDNFLLETATPDKDLIGIITHFDRINNVWLCLTELDPHSRLNEIHLTIICLKETGKSSIR